jgi:hypothetical protein
MSFKFSNPEIKVIEIICGQVYDMDFDYEEGPIDFEGKVLNKSVYGGYMVHSWDMEEVYYEGTLVGCCKYIIGGIIE